MDRKQELTSVDLAALTTELAAYEGARLDKAYLYEDDLIRLKLRHFDHGRVELLIDLGATKHARIADHEHVPPAPERPPNFAMMMRNRLAGATLSSATQYAFDRILRLQFDRDDETITLIAELFGDGNFAVVSNGTVVDSLETVRLKSRTVAPGAPYEYPDARFNPLSADFEAVVNEFEASDSDVVRTLATRLNFGGLWAEELCRRAAVDKTLSIDEASRDTYRSVYDAAQTLRERLATGSLAPQVYYADEPDPDPDTDASGDRPLGVAPVPMLEHDQHANEEFDSFTTALDVYFSSLETESDQPTGTNRPDFESQIETQKRIIQQQQGAIESFDEQAERIRERAERLYANYEFVDELLSTIREAREDGRSWEEIRTRLEAGNKRGNAAAAAVQSVDGSDGTVMVVIDDVTVELRVADGVEKNADRLYQEAKQIEAKKSGAKAAIEDTRATLASIKAERADWEAADADAGGADGKDTVETADTSTEASWLERDSIPVRHDDQWYEQFRWFHTTDGFLVIGGRNASQNETLVKKYLDRGDLFVHTQAHGGPATILKATGPSESYDDVTIPAQSKQETAQFAVSYASVWKDSKYAGDAYIVNHDQVSKTPESGEYLAKGGFAIRGDRTYFDDVPVGVAVGITCEPETQVIGGPPAPITEQAETTVTVAPGRYAQGDVAKRIYREFRTRFADESFVRRVASPDLIQEFLPPGTSVIKD
ncbi:MAG: putative eukaryotic snRNP-like RNA-binding protein [halophilic archaeon J07HX5]|nr:MAG: putative eukaryotic snRNP-like RNA-binding protein [halophilic archaeon J07HX5]